MPCDQIMVRSVNLKAANKHLMKKALTGHLKWRVTDETETSLTGVTKAGTQFTVDFKSGKVNVRGYGASDAEAVADEIKGAYAKTVVEEGLRRTGWAIPAWTGKGQHQHVRATRRF